MFHHNIIEIICTFLSNNNKHIWLSCNKYLYSIKQQILLTNNVKLNTKIKNLSFYNSFSWLTLNADETNDALINKFIRRGNRCEQRYFSDFQVCWRIFFDSKHKPTTYLPNKLKRLDIYSSKIITNITNYMSNKEINNFLTTSKTLREIRKITLYNQRQRLNNKLRLLDYYDNFTYLLIHNSPKNIIQDLPKNIKRIETFDFKFSDFEILSKYKNLTHFIVRHIEPKNCKHPTELNITYFSVNNLSWVNSQTHIFFANVTELTIEIFEEVHVKKLLSFPKISHIVLYNINPDISYDQNILDLTHTVFGSSKNIDCIQTIPHLTHITFGYIGHASIKMLSMFKNITHCTILQPIDYVSIKKLAMLDNLTYCTIINFNQNLHLKPTVAPFKNLTHLTIEEFRASDLKILHWFKKLTHITICYDVYSLRLELSKKQIRDLILETIEIRFKINNR